MKVPSNKPSSTRLIRLLLKFWQCWAAAAQGFLELTVIEQEETMDLFMQRSPLLWWQKWPCLSMHFINSEITKSLQTVTCCLFFMQMKSLILKNQGSPLKMPDLTQQILFWERAKVSLKSSLFVFWVQLNLIFCSIIVCTYIEMFFFLGEMGFSSANGIDLFKY